MRLMGWVFDFRRVLRFHSVPIQSESPGERSDLGPGWGLDALFLDLKHHPTLDHRRQESHDLVYCSHCISISSFLRIAWTEGMPETPLDSQSSIRGICFLSDVYPILGSWRPG